MKRVPQLGVFVCLAFLAGTANAQTAPGESKISQRIQERFVAPCCSDDMRAEIDRLLKSGKSESDIVEYYAAKYGEQILKEPRGSGGTWLTVTPFVAVGLAAMGLGWFIWRMTRKAPASPDDQLD